MGSFLYSKWMFYLLIVLLILAFFLPELVGPVPALIIGGLIIGFAIFVYNEWTKTPPDDP